MMQNYPVGKELKVTAVNEIGTFMCIMSWMYWKANVKPCLSEHKREHIICCLLALTLILLIFLFQKILSALNNVFNALQTNFILEANTLNPNQTAPKGVV